jgi:hypothetical protein
LEAHLRRRQKGHGLSYAGSPWDPQEREERKDNGRPCLTLDELHQYVNQLINDVRMNKIGIKVDPKGAGATSLTASTRQGIIRNIEFESNAQTAYTTAFEGAAQRGYGFAKVIRTFASPESWDQVIKIVRIPNPDTVLMDPNCVEATCSDAEGCFVFTVMRKADFKRKYPWAERRASMPTTRSLLRLVPRRRHHRGRMVGDRKDLRTKLLLPE